MKRNAIGAVGSQATQALGSFLLQLIVVRTLGLDGMGVFSLLYGVIVLVAAITTGFVGDSLVVLERRFRTIRSALQQYALLFAVGGAATAAVITWASGLVTPLQALLFAAAVTLFVFEELLRRLLMANMAFLRVAAIDAVALLGTVGIAATVALTGSPSLDAYLLAIGAGQIAALALGIALLPREERFMVAPTRGGYGAVAAYGSWRASQQLLRPALLTAVRTLVTLALGLAATGLLETARVYVAPAMLVISGLTSFLFVSYAANKNEALPHQLARADRAVAVLLATTIVLGVAMVAGLPLLGPALFGATPELTAVLGWLAYAASVSAVTPYGALAAVRGRQALVFGIRLADTVLSTVAVAILLLAGGDAALAPVVLAVGSIAGGVALRTVVLSRR